jgi:hypothetical protein
VKQRILTFDGKMNRTGKIKKSTAFLYFGVMSNVTEQRQRKVSKIRRYFLKTAKWNFQNINTSATYSAVIWRILRRRRKKKIKTRIKMCVNKARFSIWNFKVRWYYEVTSLFHFSLKTSFQDNIENNSRRKRKKRDELMMPPTSISIVFFCQSSVIVYY